MRSKLTVAGHPVHPVIAMFPLAPFAITALLDFGDLVGGPALLGRTAYWTLAAGLVLGVLAVAAAAVDFATLPWRTRAKRAAAGHVLLLAVMLGLFGVVWLARRATAAGLAGGALFALEVMALVAGAVAARLGLEVVDRIGVGSRPERADLDAPELNALDFGLPGLRPPVAAAPAPAAAGAATRVALPAAAVARIRLARSAALPAAAIARIRAARTGQPVTARSGALAR
ncbi:MAG TPA: DUF2231 domain-containing protein [Pilimelia sp.]|nr:DUF2231 domain-containing protein [Pilimelia sp.]